MTSTLSDNRLYDDLAWTFPIISPLEDYLEETELFSGIIREHARIPLGNLLHLGCGGGHNDFVLKKYFLVTGVDRSEAMLKMARQLNPEVTYLCGDILDLSLARKFDAVVAVNSLDYMVTEERLRAACATAFRHLNPGGVFFFLLEVTKETFIQNRTIFSSHSRGDTEIIFIENCYDPDPGDTSYEATFIYLIRRGGKLEIQTDRHLCGLFSQATVERALIDVGFEVRCLAYAPPPSAIEHSGLTGQERYPMFVCLKRG